MNSNKFKPKNVCSETIHYSVDDNGCVRNVSFMGGCPGNAIALAKVIDGMNINDVILKLKGVNCKGRGTSCPDQLSKALEFYLEQHPELKR